jgi:putative ATP-dependent endonuclease of OLD family
MLVFALLTIIADPKGRKSVIFAMEEPEIALPPHTQRRATRFVLREMGQSIVTSHSPYVIEQFKPGDVVMVQNSGDALTSSKIDASTFKPKTYQLKRRQLAEAILARAVLVVEGSTEVAVFNAASAALERLGAEGYVHVDLAGVSLFDADGDKDVPKYAPIFKGMDKLVYGAWDKQASEFDDDAKAKIAQFDAHWEAPETGIERVLVKQTTTAVLRRFLDEVSERDDYPGQFAYTDAVPDNELQQVATNVLKARKGEAAAYAATLLDQCETINEVPEFLRRVLISIDQNLRASSGDEASETDDSESDDLGLDDLL